MSCARSLARLGASGPSKAYCVKLTQRYVGADGETSTASPAQDVAYRGDSLRKARSHRSGSASTIARTTTVVAGAFWFGAAPCFRRMPA
ncbi:MAG: hypothetical protein JWN04_2394 [Myxococcaceae bacterium]|nr:hypothetical protein [Myxococcaceae bacterium]